QVGRAGRAVDLAYGILLSGDEDEEITNYFINTAFPPQIHTQQVLTLLNEEEGLSVPQLEQRLNLSKGQIDKVLKLLSSEFPSPVTKIDSKWSATPINYQPDEEKIAKLTAIRRQEQATMSAYMQSQQCLMAFLAKELDDANPQNCGKCAVCLGKPLLSVTCSLEMENQAVLYLRRSEQIIEPRKQWPSSYNPRNINNNLRAEPGRALSLWGDAGWGELVKQGKYRDNYFHDSLVQATVDMIQRWQPQPFPSWVTCVPSLNRPELVPNFAQRLAEKLGLTFVPIVRKVKQTQLQKSMSNSYQQAHNLDGAFVIDAWPGIGGSVFLVDDMVDSRWTFTVIAALLRSAGSGQVFPVALALNTLGRGD
ncbi:ATP-dependent DNA helicase RecG, partial [Nostoc sp. NIES-2111]